MTIHACDQARRRVLAKESVANDEKLFSLFEPQTQLIKRGKVPQPVEFGHRILVVEEGAGFVCDTPHGLKPGGFSGVPEFHGRSLSRATEGVGSSLRLVPAASTQNLFAQDTIL